MTTRYKMTVAYDGHLFHGFQYQPYQRTVQGTIETALYKMTKGKTVIVEGSGRTDAGVHALGQVIHFDYPGKQIPPERMICAMNSMMPLDIIFKKCAVVDEKFHVRYSAKGKWYRYCVSLDRFVDPFKRFYTGHYPYPVNIEKMKKAATDLLGTHDFTSFAASGGQIKNKVRTMYYVNIQKDQRNNEIIFDFICSGFLYNMVRILVAMLLEIGRGKRPVNDIPRVISAKDREQVRETAPASGLFLYHVFYENIPEKYRLDRD
ncbi:tRNA pseudouridine(38-40) synthase TruA [Lactobacillus kullabergensis]|uniref:tRNA pseudouridine(38-40) synthase TruA n=1 Tax=Lactobacillus TaxID=1578 RepID=UPI0018DB483F|nr:MULTISPECIES: tRNA pseudouridine(38-40) synthase TruA [Lactobacillus]MBI0121864.1 tRNA pseudouridine(38-40) synthase TruA [Lactobacillus sp. M0398]MBI0123797.1 tRNA pseudouridine(38-40) synthase TruA [Lactobacillus sp. W8174]MBI0135909.1 tRNA pseudouridine(38-40) synthase TruA [Lactobacillus sp. W8173]MCX0291377.1 tRNA pseudouridine(38-40) synthase TruA [Lactobacillus kullabergensis]